MRSAAILGLAFLATAASGAALAADAADADALQWVSMIDRGDYAGSWSNAGGLFQSHITSAAWAGQAGPTREPLGEVKSRKVLSEEDAATLPGAPDGTYKIIRFTTVFAHKQDAVETVVLAKEAAGWKVDGYFIK